MSQPAAERTVTVSEKALTDTFFLLEDYLNGEIWERDKIVNETFKKAHDWRIAKITAAMNEIGKPLHLAPVEVT